MEHKRVREKKKWQERERMRKKENRKDRVKMRHCITLPQKNRKLATLNAL